MLEDVPAEKRWQFGVGAPELRDPDLALQRLCASVFVREHIHRVDHVALPPPADTAMRLDPCPARHVVELIGQDEEASGVQRV